MELQAATRALGGPRLSAWNYPDRNLAAHPEIVERLRTLIVAEQPQRVYVTSPFEVAPDHLAAWRWLARALEGVEHPPAVWAYEIWVPLLPTHLVAIDCTWASKQAALACYVSQHQPIDVRNLAEHLSALRAMTLGPHCLRAEGFLCGATAATPSDMLAWRTSFELERLTSELIAARARHTADQAKIHGLLDRLAALDLRLALREQERASWQARLMVRLLAALRRCWTRA
jgi:hypothetical protein